jgi:hypothetical protein
VSPVVGAFDRSLRKLNLGCGFDHRPGYLNVDLLEMHEPDLLGDVRDLSMLDDGRYDEILAIDVLEHLERGDTPVAVAEWFRLLAPDGRLQVQAPDVLGVAALLRELDTVEDHRRQIQNLFGTQAYTGDYHLAGFTDLVLIAALSDAGFDRIEVERRDRWLLDVVARRPGASAARDPIAIGLDAGAYPPDAPGNPVRWCQQDAELLIANTGRSPVRVEVRFLVAHPSAPGQAAFEIRLPNGLERLAEVGEASVFWRHDFVLEPGPVRIHLHSEAPPADAPNDPRVMHFRLADLSVQVMG